MKRRKNMTIKTLTRIHNLLTEDKKTRYHAYQLLRDASDKANDEKAPNAKYLEKQKNEAWDIYIEASNALDEFESHDWH